MTYRAEIPYWAYWTGLIGALRSLAGRERSRVCIRSNSQPPQPDASIAQLGIDGEAIEHGVLGFSVLQAHSFYGLPWGWRRGP